MEQCILPRMGESVMITNEIVQQYFREQIKIVERNVQIAPTDGNKLELELLRQHKKRIYIALEPKLDCGQVVNDEDSLLFLKGFYRGATQ